MHVTILTAATVAGESVASCCKCTCSTEDLEPFTVAKGARRSSGDCTRSAPHITNHRVPQGLQLSLLALTRQASLFTPVLHSCSR